MEYPIEIDVIFVDDDIEICNIMKELFYRWGLRYFKVFSDVQEAVEYCLSQDLGIAIFIVDYNLGGQTEIFFLDQVRRNFPNADLSPDQDRRRLIGDLEHMLTELNLLPKPSCAGETRVFISHGHDELAKLKVARFIEEMGMTAVILAELSL